MFKKIDEVDGYGSNLIMDDANIPSLLSLSLIGFLPQNDTIYQNTRKLVLSSDNPYYFSGPRGSGIGGPHVSLFFVATTAANAILLMTRFNLMIDFLCRSV